MVGVTVVVFGISFGFLAVTAGISPTEAVVMSLMVNNGAGQFAAVAAIAGGASLMTSAVAGVAVIGRLFPLGIVAGPTITGGPVRRALAAHLVTDPGIALGMGPDGRVDQRQLLITGAVVLVPWIGGTAIGAWGGGRVVDPGRWGLDAAYPAMFLALLAPQLRSDAPTRAATITGAAVAAVTLPVLPSGMPIVVSAAGAAAGAWIVRARAAKEEDDNQVVGQ